jgi:hypothetical protein
MRPTARGLLLHVALPSHRQLPATRVPRGERGVPARRDPRSGSIKVVDREHRHAAPASANAIADPRGAIAL